MGTDMCRCHHTKAWHMAQGERVCIVAGCRCEHFEARQEET